ncbi:hypothetical protein SAY87_014231 [Trapa incisa]|uniref:F-box domain-containing protein n=1 Tax=Trapa incisa TaxID=236973 RepID=A0AAN7GWF0_9MYRT|nr:hypothetical protein SAY87_014231 [Trapa incisa]
MDAPTAPICLLPEDALLQIFSSLSLRQIIVCQSVPKFFRHLLTSPFFARHLLVPVGSQLRLVSVRPPRHRRHNHHHRKDSCHSPPSQKSSTVLHAFDPSEDRWLRFSLEFLPFRYLHPIQRPRSAWSIYGASPLPRLRLEGRLLPATH